MVVNVLFKRSKANNPRDLTVFLHFPVSSAAEDHNIGFIATPHLPFISAEEILDTSTGKNSVGELGQNDIHREQNDA